MIQTVSLDKFDIGESQNTENTIFFAKPHENFSSVRDLFLVKKYYLNQQAIQKIESGIQHYCQFVRNPYLLRPDYLAYGKSNEMYVFMEKMKSDLGFILSNRMRKEEFFTSEEIKAFLKQVSSALEELERKDFPHGNLKPSNILKTFNGGYKISDVSFPSTKEKYNFYKSPEQNFGNAKLDLAKADVFCLGLIVLQMTSFIKVEELQIFKAESNNETFRKIEETFSNIGDKYGKLLTKILRNTLIIKETTRKSIIQLKDDIDEYCNLPESPRLKGSKKLNFSDHIESNEGNKTLNLICSQMKLMNLSIDYFYRFNYNSFNKKIEKIDFMKAMHELDIPLNEDQKFRLFKLLDPENTGILDLQKFSELLNNTRPVPSADNSNDRSMRRIFDEINNHCKKNQIDYKTKCMSRDFSKSGVLLLEDLKFLNNEVKLKLTDADYDIILKKYDYGRNNQVHYEDFLQDFKAQYLGIPKIKFKYIYLGGAEGQTDQHFRLLYDRIRETYNTINELFNDFDLNAKNSINYEDFISILRKIRLDLDSNEIKNIWIKFEKDNTGNLRPFTFKTSFSKYVENDLKSILNQISENLFQKEIELSQTLKSYLKNDGFLIFDQLFEAMKQINNSFKIRDFSFLLNELEVRRNGQNEINLSLFENKILEKMKELNLKVYKKLRVETNFNEDEYHHSNENKTGEQICLQFKLRVKNYDKSDLIKLFGSVDLNKDKKLNFKEFEEIVNLFWTDLPLKDRKILFNYFDENKNNFISYNEFFNRIYPPSTNQNDEFVKFSFSLNILQKISTLLKEKKLTPDKFFYEWNGNMKEIEFRLKLKEIGYPFSFESEKFEKLINLLKVPNEFDLINSELFIKLLNTSYNMNKSLPGNSQPKVAFANQTIFWKSIYDSMNLKNLSFDELFEKYNFGDNCISIYDFEHIVKRILNIDLNIESFSKSISEFNKIPLLKLKNGLGLEREMNKMIQDLKNMILKNNIDIERLFQKLDLNENSFIECNEFSRMLQNIDGNIRMESSRQLFDRFDTNGDHRISLSEFKKMLAANNLKKEELCTSFFEKISQMIRERNLIFTETFTQSGDGIFYIKNFYSGLSFLKYDVDQSREKIMFLLDLLSENMPSSQLDFDRFLSLYNKYKTKSGGESTSLSTNELAKIDNFGRYVRQAIEGRKLSFEKAFMSKDLFNNGYISNEELKKTFTIDLLIDHSLDMNLFIRSVSDPDGKVWLNKLKEKLVSSADKNISQTLSVEDFFLGCLPSFENNRIQILTYFLSNRDTITKVEFFSKATELNLFEKEQIMNVYSKLDKEQAGKIKKEQIESVLGLESTIKKIENPQDLIKQISMFISSSRNNLKKGFENLDQRMTGLLSFFDVKKIFQNNGFETISISDLEKYGNYFNLIVANQIDYTRLLDISMNVENKARPVLDSESVLNKIREGLLQKNASLIQMMQRYDRGNQMVSFDTLIDEINNKVLLSRDEVNSLGNNFKPNQNNQVNYYDIANIIMNQRMKTPANFIENIEDLRANVNSELLRNKLLDELKNQGISIRALFRRIDLDNDEYLSFKEFSEYVQRLLGNNSSSLSQDKLNNLFMEFDIDKDYRISFYEFNKNILNSEKIDEKLILTKIKKQIFKKNNNLEEVFKNIDKDGNKEISYVEFKEFLEKNGAQLSLNELQTLFQYFDKEKKDIIPCKQFIDVLNEDIFNIESIKKAALNHLKENGLGVEAFFRSLNSKGNDDFLSKFEFDNFLIKMGFKYDNEGKEEVFLFFDKDKDYRISLLEFKEALYGNSNSSPNSGQILKTIIQTIIEQCDFKRLKPDDLFDQFDYKGYGTLDYKDFEQILNFLKIKVNNDELNECFKIFDRNKNNVISKNEFISVLRGSDPTINLKNNYHSNNNPTRSNNLNNDYYSNQNKNLIPDNSFNQGHNYPNNNYNQSNNNNFINQNNNYNPALLSPNPHHSRNNSLTNNLGFNNSKEKLAQSEYDSRELDTEFNEKIMINQIKLAAESSRQPLFELFCQFDENNCCRLSNPDSLSKICLKLGLNFPNSWISQLFEYYSPPNEQLNMNYLRLMMDINNPSEILKKTINYVMSIQQIDIKNVFASVDEDKDEKWMSEDFKILNDKLMIGMDSQEIGEIFHEWAFNHKNYITLDDLNVILGSNKNINNNNSLIVSQMQDPHKSQIMHQQELMDKAKNHKKIFDEMRSKIQFKGLKFPECISKKNVKNIEKKNMKASLKTIGCNVNTKEFEKFLEDFTSKTNKNNVDFDTISEIYENYDQIMNPKLLLPKNPNFDNHILRGKYEKVKAYVNTILDTFKDKKLTIERVFGENQIVERIKFLTDLKRIQINTERQDIVILLNGLSVSESAINLLEFDHLLKNFDIIFGLGTQQNEFNDKPANISVQINNIMIELKSIIEEEGFQIITQFDVDRSGWIAEKDLFFALTGDNYLKIDPCEEIDVFINYVSEKGRVSLEKLKKVLNLEEKNKKPINSNKFGVASQNQARPNLPKNNQEYTSKFLKELLVVFTSKGKNASDVVYYFFQGVSLVEKLKFVDLAIALKSKLSEQNIIDLFNSIDVNNSGTISINEFKLLLDEPETDNKQNYSVPEKLDKEIMTIFDEVDKDKSGFIEKNELKDALIKIGINPTIQEIDKYMLVFDKNKDEKISFDEFKFIFYEKIRSEMMLMDETMANLRKEFRKADINQTRMLNMDQLNQVFKNLNIDLKRAELEGLFREIDVDNNGSIDIDELIYFMTSNQEGISPAASSALLSIQCSNKLSLSDFKDVFKNMPANFTLSFIRLENKKIKILPSATLKPTIDSSGLFYSNLNIRQSQSEDDSCLRRSNPSNYKLLAEVKLNQATGVPIPSEQNISRASIHHREVKISLFDRSFDKFIGNTVNIPAYWKAEYEDRWYFIKGASSSNEANFYLKLEEIDDNKISNISLIIEFVIYFSKSNKLLDISCGYASIDLVNLNAKGSSKIKLNLEGGAPNKKLAIRKDDIKTNRTGWRKIVKKISKNINSELELDIISGKSLPNSVTNDISALPPLILCNKGSLSLFKTFREFLGKKAFITGNLNLNLYEDLKIKAFLNCIDCPDIFPSLSRVWNELILPKLNSNSLLKSMDAFSKMLDQFYLVLTKNDFAFNASDPTSFTFEDQRLNTERANIINSAVEEIQIVLGYKQRSINFKKLNDYGYSEPITLNTVDSDEDEINFMEQLTRKSKKTYESKYGKKTEMKPKTRFGF